MKNTHGTESLVSCKITAVSTTINSFLLWCWQIITKNVLLK